MDMKITDP